MMKKINKTRFEKNNFANDSFRKRNYENEIAKENKNNKNLNFKKWILIESKNIFKSKNEKRKKKYFFSSTNNRHVFLSNANSIASKTFEIIDEMSKSNCFANNDSASYAKFLIVKNAQNFLKKEKIVAIIERILKRKKFFKSLSRDIDKISNMLCLENVANSENLAFRKWIKNVSNKKATFNVSFLKLRIVLFILQQFNSLTQRVRFFVEKTSMKHNKKKTKTSNVMIWLNATTSNRTLFARKLISTFLLNEISRTIYCAEKTNNIFFQVYLKKNFWSRITMIRMLIISNMKKR